MSNSRSTAIYNYLPPPTITFDKLINPACQHLSPERSRIEFRAHPFSNQLILDLNRLLDLCLRVLFQLDHHLHQVLDSVNPFLFTLRLFAQKLI
jgi:hypothetical protein